jgi:ABC-2 type transport system permease protein
MLRDRLLGSVLGKTVRDWLPWGVGAIVALWILGAFYVIMMSAAGDAYISLIGDMPPALASIYGQQDGTAAGMALSGMYSLMGPIVLLAYAIGLGASAAVGEEEGGTLPLLLSSHLRRRSILLTKSLVVGVGVVVIAVAMGLGLVASATLVGLDLSGHDVLGPSLQLIGLALFFAALSLSVSAWRASSSLGIGVAAAMAVASWFLTTTLPVVEGLADVARLTPWYLYSGANALYEGLDPLLLFAALGLAATLFAAGARALDRRDLRA